MRLLIQRVASASIDIDGKRSGSIQQGVVCYLGVSRNFHHENLETILKAVNKLLSVRLWPDEDGKLKASLQDIEGSVLVVSNFTLRGTLKKGTALDFSQSQQFNLAKKTYDSFVDTLTSQYRQDKIITGSFGAMMHIQSVNDGPVNIVLDF